nr:hypothetical protein KK1_038316 [Ipomoea trifida]
MNEKGDGGLTGDAGGAVNEDEDHATESPGDAEDADAAAVLAAGFQVGLVAVPDDRQNAHRSRSAAPAAGRGSP